MTLDLRNNQVRDFSISFHKLWKFFFPTGFVANMLRLLTKINSSFARVLATLNRFGSASNPMPFRRLPRVPKDKNVQCQ